MSSSVSSSSSASDTPMRETDIRPGDLMVDLAKYVENDRKWLVDRSKDFVPSDCPACGTAGSTEFEKGQMHYDRCPKCRTVFANPRPCVELLHQFYERSETYAYWNEAIFPASEDARRQRIFVPRVDRILEIVERHGVGRQTMLEIGAGFGTFCDELVTRERFDEVIALEMTPGCADSCRRRGLRVIEQPVEQLDGSIRADLVASFETLEHVYSPTEFLTAVRNTLRPGGLAVLTCPSIDGFDVSVLGVHSDTVDHEHLNYLNPNAMGILADRCGFELLDVMTPGQLDVDIVRNKFMADPTVLDQHGWVRDLVEHRFEECAAAFQEFLAANRLSTHMWTVLRRPAE